jgi:hypothetical protein
MTITPQSWSPCRSAGTELGGRELGRAKADRRVPEMSLGTRKLDTYFGLALPTLARSHRRYVRV